MFGSSGPAINFWASFSASNLIASPRFASHMLGKPQLKDDTQSTRKRNKDKTNSDTEPEQPPKKLRLPRAAKRGTLGRWVDVFNMKKNAQPVRKEDDVHESGEGEESGSDGTEDAYEVSEEGAGDDDGGALSPVQEVGCGRGSEGRGGEGEGVVLVSGWRFSGERTAKGGSLGGSTLRRVIMGSISTETVISGRTMRCIKN